MNRVFGDRLQNAIALHAPGKGDLKWIQPIGIHHLLELLAELGTFNEQIFRGAFLTNSTVTGQDQAAFFPCSVDLPIAR